MIIRQIIINDNAKLSFVSFLNLFNQNLKQTYKHSQIRNKISVQACNNGKRWLSIVGRKSNKHELSCLV